MNIQFIHNAHKCYIYTHTNERFYVLDPFVFILELKDIFLLSHYCFTPTSPSYFGARAKCSYLKVIILIYLSRPQYVVCPWNISWSYLHETWRYSIDQPVFISRSSPLDHFLEFAHYLALRSCKHFLLSIPRALFMAFKHSWHQVMDLCLFTLEWGLLEGSNWWLPISVCMSTSRGFNI